MYKSVIKKLYYDIRTQFEQEEENMVMKAVRKVGVNVDKEELIKALQYDREQYEKGYADAKSDLLDKIRADIEEYKSRQLSFAIGVEDLEKGKQVALEYVLGLLDEYR